MFRGPTKVVTTVAADELERGCIPTQNPEVKPQEQTLYELEPDRTISG